MMALSGYCSFKQGLSFFSNFLTGHCHYVNSIQTQSQPRQNQLLTRKRLTPILFGCSVGRAKMSGATRSRISRSDSRSRRCHSWPRDPLARPRSSRLRRSTAPLKVTASCRATLVVKFMQQMQIRMYAKCFIVQQTCIKYRFLYLCPHQEIFYQQKLG